MWRDMFVIQLPVLEKVLRTVLVYATVVVLFRLSGKRGLANLNTLDLAVVALLSNSLQNAIIGSDNSIVGGVIGALTLVVVNAALNHGLARSDSLTALVEGRETTVIEHGHEVKSAMKRLALRPAELDHAVRMQNGDDIRDVENGRLGPGGQLVLTLKREEQGATKADVAALRAQLTTLQSTLDRLGGSRQS
jgi:uncharacterized membrane protein YcaP (DUF421 family)